MDYVKKSIALFQEMSNLLKADDTAKNARFRAAAYDKAAVALMKVEGAVPQGYEQDEFLKGLGLGQKTIAKFNEIKKTGTFSDLEQQRKAMGLSDVILQMAQLRGMGIKTAKKLQEKYKFTSLGEFKQMAQNGVIKEKIVKKCLDMEKQVLIKRWPREMVADKVEPMIEGFRAEFPEATLVVCGSYRRKKDSVKDVDIMIMGPSGQDYTDWIQGYVGTEPRMHGPEELEIVTTDGLMIDVRVVPTESFGAALLFFTGPKEYNIDMRIHAKTMGYKLNRFGLLKTDNGEVVASQTEEEIFDALNLKYQTPEEREKEKRIKK